MNAAPESERGPVASFAEIRALLPELPGPDLESATRAVERERRLAKPAGALGRLEALAEWLATWQGRHPPQLRRPRVALFAGNHGSAGSGAAAETAWRVQNLVNGGAAVNQLCQVADADLRVYELDLDTPTADFTQGPAMSEEDCARAIAYGMMAVEPGIDLLCLGEIGIGNSSSAAALCAALFGKAADWTGPESGLGAATQQAVAAALAANRAALADPLEILRCLGGLELAAIVGAVLAARLARTPVLLDGFACTAAAAVLAKADRHFLDHCQAAHRAAEPGHARLLERLGKQPLFDLGLRLGEGAGAALAIPLLKAAAECHAGMAAAGAAE